MLIGRDVRTVPNVNDHQVAPEYIFTECNASPLNRVDIMACSQRKVSWLFYQRSYNLFFSEVQLESSFPQKTRSLNNNNINNNNNNIIVGFKRQTMSVFLRMVCIKQPAQLFFSPHPEQLIGLTGIDWTVMFMGISLILKPR